MIFLVYHVEVVYYREKEDCMAEKMEYPEFGSEADIWFTLGYSPEAKLIDVVDDAFNLSPADQRLSGLSAAKRIIFWSQTLGWAIDKIENR